MRPALTGLLALAMLLLLSAIPAEPVRAAEAAADEAIPPPPNAYQQNPNRRICKKVRSTSTRIPQKVCMTQRQWDEVTEQGRKTAAQLRDGAENVRPINP
jgi:hypothetical protein